MAPQANIILFEANSSSYADLLTAVNTARNTPGVTVVSMSFGSGEFSSETLFDSYFTTPVGHTGVTFVASTGDNGAPGGYPAFSSNVVAVGGTTLSVTAGGGYISESAWSSGGGGTSRYEVEPVWQRSVQTSGRRTTPDLSMDANPYSGVPVFDSWDFGTATPWIQVGGTSLSAPLFGGIVATANQGRVLAGATSLDGATQTLPALYSLSSSDFHDVVSGSNGNPARAGYDLATGRGTPVGNLLIADLVSYGATPARKVVATPTTTLTRSQPLGSLFESSTSSAATTSSAPVSLVSPAMTDTAAGLVPTLWARSRRSDFAAAV
jgi:hypothetical protein